MLECNNIPCNWDVLLYSTILCPIWEFNLPNMERSKMMINSSLSNLIDDWQLSHRTVVEIPISLSLRWTVPQKELRHMFKKVKSVLESRMIRPCNNPGPCWSYLHVHAGATFRHVSILEWVYYRSAEHFRISKRPGDWCFAGNIHRWAPFCPRIYM